MAIPGIQKLVHSDDQINRIQQGIGSALNPVLSDMSKPSCAWLSLSLRGPWGNAGTKNMPDASIRTLVDGSVMVKGVVSSSSTQVTLPSTISSLPLGMGSSETRYLPLQACYGTNGATDFVGSAVIVLTPQTPTTGSQLQFVGVIGQSVAAGDKLVVSSMSLEFSFRD